MSNILIYQSFLISVTTLYYVPIIQQFLVKSFCKKWKQLLIKRVKLELWINSNVITINYKEKSHIPVAYPGFNFGVAAFQRIGL